MFEQPLKRQNSELSPEIEEKKEKAEIIDFEERLTENTAETFSLFQELLRNNNYQEFKDVNAGIKELDSGKLIVRRENPKQILSLLSGADSYEVDFFGDDRYSNCVEWSPEYDGPKNISNAYLEGFTNLNNVVTVIGFAEKEGDDLAQLEDATANFHGLDRSGVRSFKGSIYSDQVKFINLRIPGHLMPESELTQDEQDRVDIYLDARNNGEQSPPVLIHRSYVRNVNDATESDSYIKKAA